MSSPTTVRDLVESTHLRSEPVRETFQGETVWEGVVEVFALTGHPTAQLAYAWAHETNGGGRRYVAVLGVPPINSAQDAVKAAVMAHIEKQQKHRGGT